MNPCKQTVNDNIISNYQPPPSISSFPLKIYSKKKHARQPQGQTTSIIFHQSLYSFPIPLSVIRNSVSSYCAQSFRYNQLVPRNITNPMRCTFNKTQKASLWLEDSSQESIFRNITHQSSQRLPKFVSNKRIISNKKHWNYSQRHQYIEFLRQFFGLFEMSNQQKRKYAIYDRMSEFISTRNYAECRIRHGSMIKRYKTIQNIIKQQERKLKHAEPLLEIKDDGNPEITQIISVEVDLKGDEEMVIWASVEDDYWSHEEKQGNLSGRQP